MMPDIHDNSSLNDLSNTICFLSEPYSTRSAKMFMGVFMLFYQDCIINGSKLVTKE